VRDTDDLQTTITLSPVNRQGQVLSPPIFADTQLVLFAPNLFRRTGRFSTVLTAYGVCGTSPPKPEFQAD
jgi:hypothetical protein